LAAIVPIQASAQDGDQAREVASDEQGVPIVVTAQFREQRLSEVPLAITAVDGEFLEQLGLYDFEEVARFVPGFDVQNQSPNNPGFILRGLGSDSGTAFNEPRVSIYQDGVSISRPRGSYVEPFDLERIEVVRGPQTTLYGRGALIGGVNIIQNKARTDRTEAFARLGLGSLDYRLAEGMVNVPLREGMAVRLSGRYRERDGTVENLLGGADFNSVGTGAIRGSLRIEPTSRITFDLIGNYQRDETAGVPFKSTLFNPTDPVTGTVIGDRRRNTGAALASAAGFEGDRRLGLDREVWGVTGIGRIELSDAVTLTSITAYREFDAFEIFDVDGTSLPIVTAAEDALGEQFSQELRLSFDNGGPLTVFVGGSYLDEQGSQRTPAQFDERMVLAQLAGRLNGGLPGRPQTDPAPLAIFGNNGLTAALLQGVAAANGAALPGLLAQGIAANLKSVHLETATNASELQSWDLFADLTYALTDRLELGLGARFTRDNKRSSIAAAVNNGRSVLGGFLGALGQPAAVRGPLLGALAVPGAANIPPSVLYPVPLFGLTFQPTANNGAVISDKLKDEGLTWRLNARYELSPDSSLYASYARGRRPKVLNAGPPGTPFSTARFEIAPAETVDSFEVGVRTDNQNLYLDGALFYYVYDNFQTIEQQGTLFVVTNAGEAESYGLEAQARWQPTPALSLFATYAYNHSRFKSGARQGNHLRLSPDHTLSAGAVVSAEVGPGRIEFVPSVTYQSRVFFDDDNDRPELQTRATGALVPDLLQDEVQGGYALANARLGYALNERFRIEAFVKNLFDQTYIKDAGNTGDGIGLPTFIAGEPRLYGLEVSARY
jgi:outer membrane receptor protein involved in Fe transport